MWYIGLSKPWQRITERWGRGKDGCASKIFFLYFFLHHVSVDDERRRVQRAQLKILHTRGPAMFIGMKYGYFIGVRTNERSDMYPYFSLWIVDVFIGHHLLCPSPYSLSWWVRRGVKGEGAGKVLIGWLSWPTQVKWNDCYCTLHNSWECHFLRSQWRHWRRNRGDNKTFCFLTFRCWGDKVVITFKPGIAVIERWR